MSMMRTQALPNGCTATGSTSSTIAAIAKTTTLLSLVMFMRCSSGAVGHAFAEQPLGSQCQHQDQHDERKDVLVVAAENAAGQRADVARAQRFDQAEQHAAEHRASEVAD